VCGSLTWTAASSRDSAPVRRVRALYLHTHARTRSGTLRSSWDGGGPPPQVQQYGCAAPHAKQAHMYRPRGDPCGQGAACACHRCSLHNDARLPLLLAGHTGLAGGQVGRASCYGHTRSRPMAAGSLINSHLAPARDASRAYQAHGLTCLNLSIRLASLAHTCPWVVQPHPCTSLYVAQAMLKP